MNVWKMFFLLETHIIFSFQTVRFFGNLQEDFLQNLELHAVILEVLDTFIYNLWLRIT